MIPTIATRFCGRRPLIDLAEITLMFTTLILQYLNELVEGKVRDFTSPQAFHTVKVQGLKDNRIKPLAKFAGELPVKVFTLVTHLPIEACDLSHTPPPTVRTFLLTVQGFVEFAEVRPRTVSKVVGVVSFHPCLVLNRRLSYQNLPQRFDLLSAGG